MMRTTGMSMWWRRRRWTRSEQLTAGAGPMQEDHAPTARHHAPAAPPCMGWQRSLALAQWLSQTDQRFISEAPCDSRPWLIVAFPCCQHCVSICQLRGLPVEVLSGGGPQAWQHFGAGAGLGRDSVAVTEIGKGGRERIACPIGRRRNTQLVTGMVGLVMGCGVYKTA